MTHLALELSQLEVEPIDLQEVGNPILQPEQDRNLETLTAAEGKNDVLTILTLTSSLPFNALCYSCACNSCATCRPPCCASCNCKGSCVVG